jgi:predicted type IV restriction endonuclease
MIEKILKSAENKSLSEIGTIFHLVLPLFKYLDWDVGMSENIIFEETTSTKKRVDIKFTVDKKVFFLEAKRVSLELTNRDFEQLASYLNSDTQADIGILTNGMDYWIADNSIKGGLEEKRIYRFSIDKISDCDLEILEYFRYPLQRLEQLPKKVKLEKLKLELDEKSCSPIQMDKLEKKEQKLKKQEKFDLEGDTNQGELELKEKVHQSIDFFTLQYSKENFRSYTEFFRKKVELAIDFLVQNGQNIDLFFDKFRGVFKREEPKKGLNFKFLEEWNIYFYLNTSSKEKEKQLEKITKYLQENIDQEEN